MWQMDHGEPRSRIHHECTLCCSMEEDTCAFHQAAISSWGRPDGKTHAKLRESPWSQCNLLFGTVCGEQMRIFGCLPWQEFVNEKKKGKNFSGLVVVQHSSFSGLKTTTYSPAQQSQWGSEQPGLRNLYAHVQPIPGV